MIQFNWRRHWKARVEPLLGRRDVQFALDLGMRIYNPRWRSGDCPAYEGMLTGHRIVRGKLSWYRSWGRCHWIVFFSFMIGKLNYPHLRWEIETGDAHTVAVGYAGRVAKVVMDIILFDTHTAEESLERCRVVLPGAPAADQYAQIYQLFMAMENGDM